MTSILEMTSEELARKIAKVKEIGWVKTTRQGPTGISHTFEGLMGYSENNLSIADWGVLEIKTTRKNQRNLVTLFSKAPTRADGLSPSELIREHGYWDETRGRQALYCSITASVRNDLGWLILLDEENQSIRIDHNGTVVATQILDELSGIVKKKINNLALILADSKFEGKDEFFHYNEAYLLAGFSLDNFFRLFGGGQIVFEWRMHLKPEGAARDHGPGYRVYSDILPDLYLHKKRIL